jgi:mono/diheme cytochrome c family protein
LLVLSLLPAAARADGPSQPSFAGDVAPLFARWCSSCHGPHHHHAGLRLDSYEAVLGGGDSGPAVIAGDAAGSPLVAKVERQQRPAMPPRRRLPRPAIAVIRAWIAAGAPR